MTADPYLDPDSGVLRNRLGITDAPRLRLVEADLTLAAIQDLSTSTPTPPPSSTRSPRSNTYTGWPINWTLLDADQNEHASIVSLRGDNTPLRDLLDQLTDRAGSRRPTSLP